MEEKLSGTIHIPVVGRVFDIESWNLETFTNWAATKEEVNRSWKSGWSQVIANIKSGFEISIRNNNIGFAQLMFHEAGFLRNDIVDFLDEAFDKKKFEILENIYKQGINCDFTLVSSYGKYGGTGRIYKMLPEERLRWETTGEYHDITQMAGNILEIRLLTKDLIFKEQPKEATDIHEIIRQKVQDGFFGVKEN